MVEAECGKASSFSHKKRENAQRTRGAERDQADRRRVRQCYTFLWLLVFFVALSCL
jgi:hypothetical protein